MTTKARKPAPDKGEEALGEVELVKRDLRWVLEAARLRGTSITTVVRATREWLWDLTRST